jgi:hypothetical protein
MTITNTLRVWNTYCYSAADMVCYTNASMLHL